MTDPASADGKTPGNKVPGSESTDGPSGQPTGGRHGRRRHTWALVTGAVVLLLVGLVAGGAIVTVTGISAEQTVQVVPSPSPSPVPATSAAASRSGQVTIGQSCLQAVNVAQSVYAELQKVGNAASHLDLSALDQLTRTLQHERGTLSKDLQRCHATVHLPTGLNSPAPTPSA